MLLIGFHSVPQHQQPWQQHLRSQVHLFGLCYLTLKSFTIVMRNFSVHLTWKSKNSVSTGLAWVNLPPGCFLLFLNSGAAIRHRELLCWVRKCHFYTSDLNYICNHGCQSSTCTLNPYPWWSLLIHADCQHGRQEWAPPSMWQIWQGLSMWGTNPPSWGAVSLGSQSGAKGQNKGLTLQIDQHLQPSLASCCCFNFLWQTLPGYCSPAQPSSVSDRQERSSRNPLGAGRNQHSPQLHLGLCTLDLKYFHQG